MSKKTMAEILVQEAPVWGIHLERREDQLLIRPADKCPVELKELLRAHKAEILDLLKAQADGLPQDQATWLHVAKQILAGEFDGADRSTRESLAIGLRSVHHPTCKRAHEKLSAAKEEKTP